MPTPERRRWDLPHQRAGFTNFQNALYARATTLTTSILFVSFIAGMASIDLNFTGDYDFDWRVNGKEILP